MKITPIRSAEAPTASEFLKTLARIHVLAKTKEDGLSLEEIQQELGIQGHWVLMVIFCIPFLQPLPVPGLSSIAGAVISLAALFLVLKRPVWIPERWKKKRIPSTQLDTVFKTAERFWKKLEKLVHPRMNWLFTAQFLWIQVICIWILAFLLALPLPIPFSNFVPAFPLFLIILGYLEQDGLVILIGDILAVSAVFFFVGLGLLALNAI